MVTQSSPISDSRSSGRHRHDPNAAGMIKGTIAYLSPSKRETARRAAISSFGVVLAGARRSGTVYRRNRSRILNRISVRSPEALGDETPRLRQAVSARAGSTSRYQFCGNGRGPPWTDPAGAERPVSTGILKRWKPIGLAAQPLRWLAAGAALLSSAAPGLTTETRSFSPISKIGPAIRCSTTRSGEV